MQNRKGYRIFLAIACFIVAGLNAKRIFDGDYSWVDVVLMMAGIVFGVLYLMVLRNKE